jgi:hypothetical protein
VHEELWKAEIDPAIFRRSLTTPSPTAAPDSYVEPTGQRAKASPRSGRPPELFRAAGPWLTQPPCGARGDPRSTPTEIDRSVANDCRDR